MGGSIKFYDSRNQKVFDSSMWETQQDFLNISTGSGAVNGAGDSYTQKQQLIRRVSPWMTKAEIMTANAVSELPFDILDVETGEIYDTSSDWKNRLGGIDSPEDLLYQLAGSLCYGKAYAIPDYVSGALVGIRYLPPNYVRPFINSTGLNYFWMTSPWGESGVYQPANGEDDRPNQEMLYFWLPDSDVEVGPAMTYPAGAAMASSELLAAMDSTIKVISERGFITPTILTAADTIRNPDQRKELEKLWDRFVRGFTNSIAKIFNGDKIGVVQVGAKVEEIAAAYPPLSKQAIENIGTSFGIPAAIFMSDMAFASEVGPMVKMWYSSGVFRAIYHAIEKTLNTQLLNRWGLRLKFKPESLDAFQEEEADRSTAWKTYVDGGAEPAEVARMLGIELPEGMTYEQVFPKKEPAPVPAALAPFAGNNNPPVEDDTEDAPEDDPQDEGDTLDAKAIEALALWRQVAVRKYKKGQPLPVDFVTPLPAAMVAGIRSRLLLAKGETDILKAFEVRTVKAAPVVDQIKRALDFLERHEVA